MLLQFSVGNFRSFKEPVTLSMVAADITSDGEDSDQNNVYRVNDNLTVLRSAVIYGPNASGKSNLFKAFQFMRNFVLDSPSGRSINQIPVEPFLLSTETEDKPSFFEAIFMLNDLRYAYGFELNTQQITAEWLYCTTPDNEEITLFVREFQEGKDLINVPHSFQEGQGLEIRTRPNALFLSVVDQWNGQIAGQITGWFKSTMVIPAYSDHFVQYQDFIQYTIEKIANNPGMKERIWRFIRAMDLAIRDFQVESKKLPSNNVSAEQFSTISTVTSRENEVVGQADYFANEVYTYHDKYNDQLEKVEPVLFNLKKHESNGTQKLFMLTGPTLVALLEGYMVFVDELASSFHPIITNFIVGFFHNKNSNKHRSQLIFTTHNTHLLKESILRPDQIWLTEKDRYGATELFSLVEFKEDETKHEEYEQAYISGRYGAIPYLKSSQRFVMGEQQNG